MLHEFCCIFFDFSDTSPAFNKILTMYNTKLLEIEVLAKIFRELSNPILEACPPYVGFSRTFLQLSDRLEYGLHTADDLSHPIP